MLANLLETGTLKETPTDQDTGRTNYIMAMSTGDR